jgi:hypothetical protein
VFRSRKDPLCRKVQGMLSEYIDNRLNDTDKHAIESHLEACDSCSLELQSLRMTVRLLHRVREVSIPRSFTIARPEPGHALVPKYLRWLRPATAIVAIALVLLLVGDFLQFFETDAGVYYGGGEGTPTYNQSGTYTITAEQQIMVRVPGIMGQMSLATAKSVGYEQYEIVSPIQFPQPTEQPVPNTATLEDKEIPKLGSTGRDEARAGWPLRQIEIALGALVFALVGLAILLRRRRGRVVA